MKNESKKDNQESRKEKLKEIICYIHQLLSGQRQSLLEEVEKEIKKISWNKFKCNCNMCYAHEKTVNQILELLRSKK